MQTRLLAGIAAVFLVLPAVAVANGDPASDILLQEKIYFPNQRIGPQSANSLKKVVREANAKGYRIRVALIRDATDLGTVPQLLGQPQRYAQFLGPEIRFVYKGDVLVVMPNGLGVTSTDRTPAPAQAIQGMKVEAGGSPEGLALTAQEAVPRLAAAAGHPLVAAKKGAGGGGSSGTVAGIIVAVALVALGIIGAVWLRRSQSSQADRASEGSADPERTAP